MIPGVAKKQLHDPSRHGKCDETVPKKAAADDTSPGTVSADTSDVMYVMIQLEQVQNFSKTTNKTGFETEFKLKVHKYEEYKGLRFYNGDFDVVVEVWWYRVDEDDSGLTFQEWDPTEDTDTSQSPVTMIVV